MDRKLLWRQANALKAQAQAEEQVQKWEQALASYEAALAIYAQIDVRSLQGRILQQLGYLARRKGLLSKAEDAYKQALALNPGSPCFKRTLLNSLAHLAVQQGQPETAWALIPQMWACLEREHNQRFHSLTYVGIGQFAEEIEAYDLAVESYQKALHNDTLINRQPNLMFVYYMGRATRKQGLYRVSWGLHAQALSLCPQNRFSLSMQSQILQSWALLEHAAGHRSAAQNLILLAHIAFECYMDQEGHGDRLTNTILEDYLAITGCDNC